MKNEKRLTEALENIIWYDGHYEWLKELRDELAQWRAKNHYSMPSDIEWHRDGSQTTKIGRSNSRIIVQKYRGDNCGAEN